MDFDRTITQELDSLVDALATAVQMDFMSRDHAKAIWRRALAGTSLDIPQLKKEVNKDDISKKD